MLFIALTLSTFILMISGDWASRLSTARTSSTEMAPFTPRLLNIEAIPGLVASKGTSGDSSPRTLFASLVWERI